MWNVYRYMPLQPESSTIVCFGVSRFSIDYDVGVFNGCKNVGNVAGWHYNERPDITSSFLAAELTCKKRLNPLEFLSIRKCLSRTHQFNNVITNANNPFHLSLPHFFLRNSHWSCVVVVACIIASTPLLHKLEIKTYHSFVILLLSMVSYFPLLQFVFVYELIQFPTLQSLHHSKCHEQTQAIPSQCNRWSFHFLLSLNT